MTNSIEDSVAIAKCCVEPGLLQAQIIGKVSEAEDLASLSVIVKGIIEQVQQESEGNLEIQLQAQVMMLNALSTGFMKKALVGFESQDIMSSLPKLPGEFADLSLRCQAEMRRTIELLHQITNDKKPSRGLRINRKISTKNTDHDGTLDTREETEASRENQGMETVGAFHRCSHTSR